MSQQAASRGCGCMPRPGEYRPLHGPGVADMPAVPEDEGVPAPQFSDGDTCGTLAQASAVLPPVDEGGAPTSPRHTESCHLLLPAACVGGALCVLRRDALLTAAIDEEMQALKADTDEVVSPRFTRTPRVIRRDFVQRDGVDASDLVQCSDADGEAPIPSDPTAASIFQGYDKKVPPAPTWLSKSLSAASVQMSKMSKSLSAPSLGRASSPEATPAPALAKIPEPSTPAVALPSPAKGEARSSTPASSQASSSPAKLAELRSEATKLEGDCKEALHSNDCLRAENKTLREELDRLMAMTSPSDTPLWSQRSGQSSTPKAAVA